MAEETLVKMVDNDGQTEEKIIKTSHTLTRTVKFPSKKEWKLADDEIAMSGEVFAGFFILEELGEPFSEVEDVATITKEGFLLIYKSLYESDSSGFMINLRQVMSVSMTEMPFSERSSKWFELMHVGICLLVQFGKIIIVAEKNRSSQWIQALGQFVPCDIEETVLFTLDGTDTEEEEEEQEDELETTGTEKETEEIDSQSEQTETTLSSVSGHHTELETISEDVEEEEKDAIMESSGQSSETHNTM